MSRVFLGLCLGVLCGAKRTTHKISEQLEADSAERPFGGGFGNGNGFGGGGGGGFFGGGGFPDMFQPQQQQQPPQPEQQQQQATLI